MRSLLLRATFAAVLGVLLLSPSAHADRQGGGTLMVVRTFDPIKSLELKDIQIPSLSRRFDGQLPVHELVRFKSGHGQWLRFEYILFDQGNPVGYEFELSRDQDRTNLKPLYEAILRSKKVKEWQAIDPEFKE